MSNTTITYDARINRYRDVASGRFVSAATVVRLAFEIVGQLLIAQNAPRVAHFLHIHPDGPVRYGPTPAEALRASRVTAWGF